VYRADLPRTFTLVAVLFLTVTATSAFAREFRAADTQNEDDPTVQALARAGALDLNRTNAALIGTFVPSMNVLAMPFLFRSWEAQRDPSAAQLIERIRKVE
jgi:hypothetical protein